jgi:hypothetical protein
VLLTPHACHALLMLLLLCCAREFAYVIQCADGGDSEAFTTDVP